MQLANKENLLIQGKQLLTLAGNGTPESLALLIALCETPIEKEMGIHISHTIFARLDEIGKLIGSHGVEYIRMDGNDLYYANQGDTYDLTILYWRGKFYIGDWGSIVENFDKFLDL